MAKRRTGLWTEVVPLRGLEIRVLVEGIEVIGNIVSLYPNDIIVEATSPVSGLRAGLHVPWFAMPQRALALSEDWVTTAITERGQREAESLLRGLYEFSRTGKARWAVDVLGPEGWTRVIDV